MKPKLVDVAKEAGVSPTTVSRVINNHGYLSSATVNKVHAAMDKLNYQPNSLARSLHGKKTNLVGVIFPAITNPFYAELIEKIEKRLFSSGYKVILCNSADNKEKERSYLKMLLANQVDGIITGAHNLGIEEYQKVGLPIVSFDRKYTDEIPIISSDNYSGGKLATQELLDAGCRHIYFLGNPERHGNPTEQRVQGYQDTMEKFGVPAHVVPNFYSDTPTIKLSAIKELLTSTTVDGIVCSDDLTAILTVQAAKQLQLKIPQQLKVIGYDGTNFTQTYYPDLSTIVQPLDDIVILLVETLFKRIDQPEEKLSQNNITLPVTLKKSMSTSNKE